MENLSSAGRNQGKMLGSWFARKYVESGMTRGGSGKVFWRSSKSDRGKESGEHFVGGFNEVLGREVCARRYVIGINSSDSGYSHSTSGV